jgi:hypothetical protein
MAGTLYVVSIADLRTSSASHITSPSENDIFYLSDADSQGAFYHDPSGGIDNTGTILVNTNTSVAFKRVIDDHLNVKWFGATGNGGTDDINAIQATVDACIATGIKRLYFPVGNYRICKGIVVQPSTPSGFVEAMVIEGETGSYGTQVGQVVISLDNENSFALGLHRVKGAQVRNLNILGQNTALGSLSQYQIQEDPTTDWINGVRNNPLSPHAGIVIDPFSNSSTPNGDRYPDFLSDYVTPNNGGSTDVVIDHCKIRYFAVNYCITPHGTPQNGEAIRINNCWGDYCKAAISTGQKQTRSVYVNNFKCWGATYSVFDCRNYGDGTSCPPEVNVLNIAGGVRYLCILNNLFTKGLIIKNMHAELLNSLGGNFTDGNGDLIIEDSYVNLTGAMKFTDPPGATPVRQPITIFKGNSLKVVNSSIAQFNASFATPLQVSVRTAVFEKCYLGFIPFNSADVRSNFTFKECSASGSDYVFGDAGIISGGYPPELQTSRILFGSGMQWIINHKNNFPFKRVKVDDATNSLTKNVRIVAFSAPVNLSNINATTLTAEFTLTTSTDDFKRLRLQDVLLTLLTDEYGNQKQGVIGVITSINGTTGVVQISGIARGINISTSYTLNIYRNEYLIPPLIIGNITSGSNVVNNVLLEASSTQLITGTPIYSVFFPLGTYIVSYSSGTLTLSNNANATRTGVDLVSANWQGFIWGYPLNSAHQIGFKEGDIIYNTRPDLHPNISFWVCIKSGLTNTAVLPQFEPVFKSQYNSTYTSNRTADISDYGKVLFLDSTSSAIVLTVDPVVFINRALQLYAKKPGANNITITPSSGTINGAATYGMTNGESINIYSDGTNFYIVSKN